MLTDTTILIQAAAVIFFAACLAHSWRNEGARAAQQWFLIGYLYALLLISLMVVVANGQIAYNSNMLVFGAAPSLMVMLYPAVFYVAYVLAKRFVQVTDLRAMTLFVFLITPWLMLPLDALGIAAQWWYFPSDSYSFLNDIPFYIPFAWGVSSAAFFAMMGRIRKIRFRGNGQFFAMIIAAPLLAGLVLILISLIQLVIDLLYSVGGITLLYIALAALLLLLPCAFLYHLRRRANHQAKTKIRNS